jgi:predicted MPP superfamily phosphohydrolase
MAHVYLIIVAVGSATLLVDLGNRLFGTYSRTPFKAAFRVAILVACTAALLLPAIFLACDLTTEFVMNYAKTSAAISLVCTGHFIWPFKWGIARSKATPRTSLEVLVPGIEVCKSDVEIANLPDSADGLKCLILTDIHCNSRKKLLLLQSAIQKLRGCEPDLVALLGDFGEHSELLPEVVSAVCTVSGRLGTFCVLGNHDCEHGRDVLLRELLRTHDVRILDNEVEYLVGNEITLVGLCHPWIHRPFPNEPSRGFAIGLSHTPDNMRRLNRLNVQIAFAGHTHGGKCRLPGFGAILVPSAFGRFLTEGWFKFGHVLMRVSRGIGYFPGRLGNRGEILFVTLWKSLPRT